DIINDCDGALLDVEPDGTVHVAWSNNARVPDRCYIFHISKPSGGSWTTPEIVSLENAK
ncbi:unnamed protein product, partial [marine sediment metagenome]